MLRFQNDKEYLGNKYNNGSIKMGAQQNLFSMFSGIAGLRISEEIEKLSRLKRYAVGDTIQAEGECSEVVGQVISGILKLSKTLPDGRQHIVDLCNAGDFFGELGEDTNPFSIESATAVTLCCINRRAFLELLGQHREFEHILLGKTIDDLARARNRLLLFGCHTTMERMATYLLLQLFIHRSAPNTERADSREDVAACPISRRDLASYLGTSVETISRNIQTLSRQNILRIIDSAHFEIRDERRLLARSGYSELDLLAVTRRQRASVDRKPAAGYRQTFAGQAQPVAASVRRYPGQAISVARAETTGAIPK